MSLSISIRRATQADIPALTNLAQQTYRVAFGDSLSASDLQNYLQTTLSSQKVANFIREDVVLLATHDTHLLGYTHLSQLSPYIQRVYPPADPANSAYLQRLYVHHEHQNQGIGSRLLTAALKQPLLTSVRYVYLDVWEKNMGAQRLYARYGFQRVAQHRYVSPSGIEGDYDYILRRDNTQH